jgi:FkbM family methyltransferase
MSIKGAIRELIGSRRYSKLQSFRKRLDRGEKTLRVGKFDLAFPHDHILPMIHQDGSQRNLALGIAAGEIARKYPGESSPLILVEPSDAYFEFLKRNAKKFPNSTTLCKAMISSHAAPRGKLVHATGTAYFDLSQPDTNSIPTKTLSDFGSPRLIKIDTDGFDFSIISTGLEFLNERRPALYFENSIYSSIELQTANDLADDLFKIGYRHFVIFDAIGLHIATTNDIDVLKDLNRFLFKVVTGSVQRHFYYYDILCVSGEDRDISGAVSEYFRSKI